MTTDLTIARGAAAAAGAATAGEDGRIIDPYDNRSLFTYFSEFEQNVWSGSLYLEVVFLVVIFVAGLGGNVMVVATVVRFDKMRTTTNCFIASLSLSDIFFTLGIPAILATRITRDWLVGDALCKIVTYIQFLSGTNSILSMMLISLDRYKTICHPQIKKLTLHQVLAITCVVWTINGLFCVPVAMGFQQRSIVYNGRSYSYCGMMWPENFHPSIYLIAMFCLLFVIPLIVIIFNYSSIFSAVRKANRKVLRSRSITSLNGSSRNIDTSSSSLEKSLTTSSNTANKRSMRVTFDSPHTPVKQRALSGADPGKLQVPMFTMGGSNISLTDASGTSSSGYHSFAANHSDIGGSQKELEQQNNGTMLESINEEREKQTALMNRTKGSLPSIGNFSSIKRRQNKCNGGSITNVQVKLIKMLVLIVVLYIVMYTPFFILINLILATDLHISSTAFTWAIICCMANTPQNPLIYGYFNENFKKAFKKMLLKCFCCRLLLPRSVSTRNHMSEFETVNNNKRTEM